MGAKVEPLVDLLEEAKTIFMGSLKGGLGRVGSKVQ
jgi:hypothetical protein